jgi:hypothetical protein
VTQNTAKIGQIGLIPDPKSWVQREIATITRSNVHHIIVCVSDTHIVEAMPGGVQYNLLTNYDNAIWSDFDLTPEQAQGTADFAISAINTPYNWLDDVLIGLSCETGLDLPKIVSDRLDSGEFYQCAQLADASLTKGGHFTVFDDGRPPGLVYPGSFEAMFRDRGWWTRPDLAENPASRLINLYRK